MSRWSVAGVVLGAAVYLTAIYLGTCACERFVIEMKESA